MLTGLVVICTARVDNQLNTQYTTFSSIMSTMESEMYVVVNGEAIMLENGQVSTYLVDVDGTIDWDSHDTLDWEDMLPEEYQMYKAAYDFLLTYNNTYMYTK